MRKFKTILFLLLGGAFLATTAFGTPQSVPMHIIDKGGLGGENTKAPAHPWYITQDDNILTLSATPVDYELQLIDEMGDFVYSAFIPAGSTQITLPSDLFGKYELRLVADTYFYRGYIELLL